MGCTSSTPVVGPSPKKGDHSPPQPQPLKNPHRRHDYLANHMVIEFSGSVQDSFVVTKQIGEGSISNIYLVQRKLPSHLSMSSHSSCNDNNNNNNDNNESSPKEQAMVLGNTKYALKQIDVELVQPGFLKEMRNEIQLLRTIDHPNIIKAYEVYEEASNRNNISMIMEYCSGGDLTRVLNPRCEEARAKVLVAKLMEAVHYLHLHGIMHRDLKFENILLENDSPQAEPKIIDFGLAQKYGKANSRFYDKVGTVYTMSPQALRGDYDQQTDVWSMGVIAYMLITGKRPFAGDTRKEIARNVVQGKYTMEGPEWSRPAQQFVRKCLQVDPKFRYTAAQALKSPWLSEITVTRSLPSTWALLKNVTTSSISRNETDSGEFKRLVLQTIAYKASSDQEILKLRDIFHALDVNHDGNLTWSELRQGLSKAGLDQNDQAALQKWFRQVEDGGEIHYTEFIAALLETQSELTHDKVVEAFQTLDRDRSGFITRQNLKDALGVSMSSEYLDQLLQEADLNGDGQVSFEEFNTVITRRTSRIKTKVKQEQERRLSLAKEEEKE